MCGLPLSTAALVALLFYTGSHVEGLQFRPDADVVPYIGASSQAKAICTGARVRLARLYHPRGWRGPLAIAPWCICNIQQGSRLDLDMIAVADMQVT